MAELMTKQEFIKIIDEIAGAYPHFTETEALVNVWYKYLGKFDEDIFRKVVSEYIMENPKPPSISDFYGRCKRITRYRKGDDD